MVNREKQLVKIISYSDTPDEYGQKHTTISNSREVEMVVKNFKNTIVNNPIYNEVELIGLTNETILDSEDVIIGDKKYKVLFTIDSNRLKQVFMKLWQQ